MSGVFPPGSRPDQWSTLGDHQRRISALEAVPASGSTSASSYASVTQHSAVVHVPPLTSSFGFNMDVEAISASGITLSDQNGGTNNAFTFDVSGIYRVSIAAQMNIDSSGLPGETAELNAYPLQAIASWPGPDSDLSNVWTMVIDTANWGDFLTLYVANGSNLGTMSVLSANLSAELIEAH